MTASSMTSVMSSPSESHQIKLDPPKYVIFQGPYTDIDMRCFTVENIQKQFLVLRILTSSKNDFFRVRPNLMCLAPSETKKHKIRIEYLEADENKLNPAEFFEQALQHGAKPCRARLVIEIRE